MFVDPSKLPLFVAAALALLLIPGPSVLYIVTRSVSQGRTAGIISALGVQCGGLVHVLAATLGLSAILMSSALAFNIVKFSGAAYLIYIGVSQWLSRSQTEVLSLPKEPLSKIFSQGFLVNVFNPKTALFFLAFLPQFVVPTRGAVPMQFLFLGLLFVSLAMVTDSSYAFLASALGGVIRNSQSFRKNQKYVTGTVYVGLGIMAALVGNGGS